MDEFQKFVEAHIKHISAFSDQFNKEYEKLTEPLKKICNQFEESMAPFKKMQDQFLNLPKFVDTFSNFFNLDYLNKLRERINDIEREEEEIKDVLTNSQWLISPALLNLDKSELFDAINNYKINRFSLFHLIKKTFRDRGFSYLKETTKNWFNNDYFLKRKKILTHALMAHMYGYYTLSIPIFLAQAEGIAGDYCQKHRISHKKYSGASKIKNSLKRRNQINNLDHPEILIYLLEEMLFAHTDVIKSKYKRRANFILNRHSILHGISTNYASEENSYRCILFLDVLAELKD